VYVIQNCGYIKPNTAASSTEYTGENAHTWNLWLARLCNIFDKLTEWSKKGVIFRFMSTFLQELEKLSVSKITCKSQVRKIHGTLTRKFHAIKTKASNRQQTQKKQTKKNHCAEKNSSNP